MSCKQSICICDDQNGLAKTAADMLVAEAGRSIRQRGIFSVALSGGSTPRGMHRLLATEPWLIRLPWPRIHIFWVDERCVPPESPMSNYGTAKTDFLDGLPLAENQIHFMVCGTSPSAGAETYQEGLMDFFAVPERVVPQFDLIFLGLGADGHTASLFPGHPALAEKEKLVVAARGGDPQGDRISMTLPLLNSARHIAFLVSGIEKSKVVRSILMDPDPQLPARKIKPLNGQLTWLLDHAAASLLPEGLQHVSIDG